MNNALPLVVVAGRPNVGKSTLVNRFVGRRDAIVEEHPGVTRDRRELEAQWTSRTFRLVDTGGWLAPGHGNALDAKVSAQAEHAVADADVVLFVVDASVGVTDEDERVARVLRGMGAPVILVANKVDDERVERDLWRLDTLGFGAAVPVSALHGRSSGDLLDRVVAMFPVIDASSATPDESVPGADDPELDETADGGDDVLAVAIVGRPNVGKSTLFNRLVGAERSIVHDEPGTTRDSIDTVVETDEGTVRFVDTAGMRRRSRVDEASEYYSMVRALESVDRADAALFVIDATQGVTHQDQRLAERVDASGTAVVIVLNKWELLDAEQRDRVRREVVDRLGFLSYAPVLQISALTGRAVRKLLPALGQAREALGERIPTSRLNRLIEEAQREHPPPLVRGRRPKVLYATQGATNPPTITLFTTSKLPRNYLRYLENRLREGLQLGPSPLKLRVRGRSDY